MNDIKTTLDSIDLRFILAADVSERGHRVDEFEDALDEHLRTLNCDAFVLELDVWDDPAVIIRIEDPKPVDLSTIIEKVRTMVYTTAMWKLL